MDISANNILLKGGQNAPISNSPPITTHVNHVNAVADAPPENLPQPTVSINAKQTPIAENPTYDRPTNTRSASAPLINQVENTDTTPAQEDTQQPNSTNSTKQTAHSLTQEKAKEANNQEQYTDVELKEISELKLRDSEVLIHERAHSAVGGQYAGSPSYSYQTGPDGVKYAVSGEVSIDISRVANDPQATLRKAQQIKAAALAPSEPSSQDRRVAAKADAMAAQARSDILQQSQDKSEQNPALSNSQKSSPSEPLVNKTNARTESDIQQKLTSRIQQISNLYQQSSTTKSNSTFQTQI